MKKVLSKMIIKYLDGFSENEVEQLLEIPPETKMGDYSLPCFALSKKIKKSPVIIANQLKSDLDNDMDKGVVSEIQNINGYLNIYLNKSSYIHYIFEKANNLNIGISFEFKNKVICMDYSSPNIAKNFHVGHLRTTVIGNSLYKIYRKLGYKVIRINHLGDWGTQFGKLIVAYKNWSSQDKVEQCGIEELLRIYVLFNAEAERNPKLKEEARSWFSKMEQGDEEALSIWKWFKEISLKEFKRVYKLLNVEFDYYIGESFYMDKVPALVTELKEKGLLEESQGANIVCLEKYNMPPCLITKSDGSSIYHSRDMAAVLYRKKKYDFEKCLYITGLEQKLHFAQVFKAIEEMGYDWAEELVHIPYGLVSLEGEKLSTRTGNIVYAEDILKEAIHRSYKLISQKNSNLKNKEQIAEMVGVGAIIFHDLFNQRIKNVNFSWDEVLSFEGASGPYIQYTYARAKSILRKGNVEKANMQINVNMLTDEVSYELVKELSKYEDKVEEAALRYEPSVIARYVWGLATSFNKFYHDCNILNAEKSIKEARLVLVYLTQKIIKDAMDLLGIQCPEEM
ncbi:arginine--tRNA ligase [Anaerocolumna sedimenticola]|uniref:Arginine--tRNA ligase n=1 Tax=Anaerocolumna sedimenticola TaxID=2696063 RepID=A0A6P1TG68_9FIRM|nr:arginine--tRNA ligase [Anaerocolumna sedimenticola]QHQ60190.1 arginine--tRNA ligase [Anaerocolumna sedimenticola]